MAGAPLPAAASTTRGRRRTEADALDHLPGTWRDDVDPGGAAPRSCERRDECGQGHGERTGQRTRLQP